MNAPEYTVELWDINGVYVADVSNIISGDLKIQAKLNDAEDVEFSLDLVQFESLCESINETPRNILEPYRTDVRIRRNGQYILGSQVVQASVNFNNQSPNSLQVKCTGYLNYFKDRYVTKNYTSSKYALMAWDLISTTQTGTNRSFGVTLGGDTASTGQSSGRVRSYDLQEVKDGIINLTRLENDNFDFYFTADKKIYLTPRMGSNKPEVELAYPQNIASMSVTRDASTLANRIILLGSGIGDERLESIKDDSASALIYKVREMTTTNNDVIEPATLDAKAAGMRDFYKNLYSRPSLDLEPNELDLNNIWLGDAIKVRVDGSTFIDDINGLYRIYEINIGYSQDGEESISLGVEAWYGA